MERWRFTEEFKREAVKLAGNQGLARRGLQKTWASVPTCLPAGQGAGRQVCAGNSRQRKSPSAEEFERMRRELAKLKTEPDILKKALAYFAADSK